MAPAPPVPQRLSPRPSPASGPPASGGSGAPPRLGWLDALRGIAALLVAVDHSSYAFMAEFREQVTPQLNIGRYGVMVFFLVSGYVIPASLERRGCVRTFWIGRAFRVYPLWAAVVGSVLALDLLGVARLGARFDGRNPLTVAVAHVTLLQELLGTPSVVLVLWTLSYELAFYLLVVALFTVRLHRRSATIAVVLGALAAVSATVALVPPASALSRAVGTGPLVALAAAALVFAVRCGSSTTSALRVPGAVTGGVLALVLVPFNGTVPLWEGLVILAVMFLGTAVRRAENGESTWPCTARTAAVVLVCAVGSAYEHGETAPFARRGWITAFLLAALTFGVALALRRRRFPRALTWLGTVSYSVYLVHPVLLAVSDSVIGRYRRDSPLLEAAFFAVLLPLAALTRRLVEVPGLARGRRRISRPRAT
ncbi:acyltransferase family protein [Streptomyces sp. NPDC058398]|uniref:acyltransferase family protein n=1 Tax=Streptomyces sp. NPDC058398 TaxID=3346479 RepID=UPI00366925CE